MHKLIDIIIPAYNRLDLLKKTLRSVSELKGFSMCDTHVFLNGCTDSTEKVLEESYKWVNIISSKKNLSMSSSWNNAKKLGKNKYYMLLHDDDMLSEDFLIELDYFISKNNNCVLIDSCSSIIDEHEKEIDIFNFDYKPITRGNDYFKSHIISSLRFICPSVVYNRTLIPKYLDYNEKLAYTLDVEFFLRCTRFGDIGYINKPIFKYRLHDRSTSSNFMKNYHLKLIDREEHRIFLKNEIKSRLDKKYIHLADNYYYGALSVDLWLFRLEQKKIRLKESFRLIKLILKKDFRILLRKIFWFNFFKLFIPQFFLELIRNSRRNKRIR